MNTYKVPFEIRQRGAIGIFEIRVYRVQAETEQAAVDAAFSAAQKEGFETRGRGPVKQVQS